MNPQQQLETNMITAAAMLARAQGNEDAEYLSRIMRMVSRRLVERVDAARKGRGFI